MKNWTAIIFDYKSQQEYVVHFDSRNKYPSDDWFVRLQEAFYANYGFEICDFDLLNYCEEL